MFNPYGSTAGAGSGDFHVYRHARAREAERWKKLNEEEKQEELDREFEAKRKADETEEDRKTAQRRAKRQRQKEAKLRKKNMKLSGIAASVATSENKAAEDDSEFTYTPAVEQKTAPVEFVNDGSFLEMMKKKLEANNLEGDNKKAELKDENKSEVDEQKCVLSASES